MMLPVSEGLEAILIQHQDNLVVCILIYDLSYSQNSQPVVGKVKPGDRCE